MSNKVIVKVIASFDTLGQMQPLCIEWEDGRTFEIDRILNVCRSASLKVGGQGTRYTCMICNKQRYLYYEEPCWFVEG